MAARAALPGSAGNAATSRPAPPSGVTGLSAGQVARRLGVAVTTVRTWDRRYGLGPAHREQGRHRRYDEHDLRRLETMCRLTADGVAPAEAARIACALARPEQLTHPQAPVVAGRPQTPTAIVRQGLQRAALALDVVQMDRILADAVARDVEIAWTDLMCPVLRAIGARHARTGAHVEAEHLLSHAISRALARVERPTTPPVALLACATDEQHTLALEALAAVLARRGVASRMLGARVPATALTAAVHRTGPVAVMLWSHHTSTADEDELRALLQIRPRPVLIAVGGPGWTARTLPPGVAAPQDLPAALAAVTDLITAATTGRTR